MLYSYRKKVTIVKWNKILKLIEYQYALNHTAIYRSFYCKGKRCNTDSNYCYLLLLLVASTRCETYVMVEYQAD